MVARLREAMRPSAEAEERARTLLEAGDLAGAEKEAQRAQALAPVGKGGQPRNGVALELLGDIYLKQGRNDEALNHYLGQLRTRVAGMLYLKVVVAYCRLGDYAHARALYKDPAHIVSGSSISSLDIPGVVTSNSLEARALLFIGMDLEAETRYREALECFLEAERLAPTSPVVSYSAAEVLMRLSRAGDAVSRFRLAGAAGHGKMAERARLSAVRLARDLAQFRTPVETAGSTGGK